MAQNVIINGVTYSEVPEVNIPKSTGGTAKFYDTASATPAAGDVRQGVTVFGKDGAVTGNLVSITDTAQNITTKSQSVPVAAGIHTGGTVQIASSEQSKIIASNIRKGVTILGVVGSMTAANISQDSSTKVLSIS